jgi:hypothetical protein
MKLRYLRVNSNGDDKYKSDLKLQYWNEQLQKWITVPTVESQAKSRCACANHQGGPCSFCMEEKYNL